MRKLLFLSALVATLTLVGGARQFQPVLGVGEAEARIGRPLSPGSIAGVNRRVNRRAYRHGAYGYGAVYGGGCHC